MPSKSQQRRGHLWLCWRRGANPEGHIDDVDGELPLDSLKKVHFERLADVIARQVFYRGLDTNLILVRSPRFDRSWLKGPLSLLIFKNNSAFNPLSQRACDPNQAGSKRPIHRVWETKLQRLPASSDRCKDVPFLRIGRLTRIPTGDAGKFLSLVREGVSKPFGFRRQNHLRVAENS